MLSGREVKGGVCYGKCCPLVAPHLCVTPLTVFLFTFLAKAEVAMWQPSRRRSK